MSQLNVRINHKYDTFAAWQASSIILGKGELAVVEIPSSATATGLTPPAIGIKVGDGSSTFSQLKWIQSTAGDVYAWAKAENKPTYKASEIDGLESFIAGEIQDTNTTYQFSYENNKLIVQSKEKTDSEWTTVAELTIDLTTKIDKVSGATAGNLPQLAADGSLTDSGEKIGDYLKSADAANTYATKTQLEGLTETVSGISSSLGEAVADIEAEIERSSEIDEDHETRIAKMETFWDTTAASDDVVNTLKEIQEYIASDESGAAAMSASIQANTQAIEALEEDSHEHENKTVLDGITSAKVANWDAAEGNAKSYADGLIATEKSRAEGVEQGLDNRVKSLESDNTTNKQNIQSQGEAIEALEEDSHTHANKTVLDGIDAAKVGAWDAAVQSVSGVTTEKTGTDVKVTAIPVNLLQNVEGDTLTFNCGTASTVI